MQAIPVSIALPVRCMRQPLGLDYLWAVLRMLGAAYFIFRD